MGNFGTSGLCNGHTRGLDGPRMTSFKKIFQEQKAALNEEWRGKTQPKRILLADDDRLSIELFVRTTTAWNYELVACLSVQETITALQKNDPLSGVILDAVFLNGDGFEIQHQESLRKAGRSSEAP